MSRTFWLVLLALSPAFAPAQNCTTYVVVGAFDRKSGDDINHLKPQDFQARMKGAMLPVVSATQDFSSRLVILMETDGAGRNAKLEDVENLTTRLARELPQGKPVVFGAFAKRAIFTRGFISDQKERGTAISEIREEANSLGKEVSLFDSLHQALELFGPHRPGDTILLVADPYDDNSHRSAGDIEKELLASGTRLLVMLRQRLSHVSRDFLWSSHDREKQFFSEITARTGGAYTDFNAHFLATFAWRGYMLGVQVPGNMNKPQKWNLKIRAAAAEGWKPNLDYPEELIPCATEQATAAAAAP